MLMNKLSILTMLIVVAGILWYYAYELLPAEPVLLSPTSATPRNEEVTAALANYKDTPVFMKNLRFNKNEITYYIEQTCTDKRKEKMKEALTIFQEETEIITFREEAYQYADILIGCSNSYIEQGENLFTAGEGGPSKIISTEGYNIIQTGKISLYRKSECQYPVVELHELSHVLGFDHSENPKSIMYPVASCEQKMTPDMITIIKELYAIEPKPDLIIKDLTATKKGRYLNFEITVTNIGLANAKEVTLGLLTEGKLFDTIKLEDVNIGYGRILTVENLKLPNRETTTITFNIDPEDNIEELDEENNEIILTEN